MSNGDGERSTQPAMPVRGVKPVRLTSSRMAAVRCACYAAWSELLASPHEADVRESLTRKLEVAAELDFDCRLDSVIRAYTALEAQQLRRQYSALFEVGSDGPPVPIREDLQTGQRSGTREDLIRFYDYFGYRLADRFSWQPDHLSVELEFMHYLCYGEASGEDNVLSFQLAQADFSARHLVSWVPDLSRMVHSVAAGTLFAEVTTALSDFVVADLQWQNTTICES